jgi:hypothetical protein
VNPTTPVPPGTVGSPRDQDTRSARWPAAKGTWPRSRWKYSGHHLSARAAQDVRAALSTCARSTQCPPALSMTSGGGGPVWVAAASVVAPPPAGRACAPLVSATWYSKIGESRTSPDAAAAAGAPGRKDSRDGSSATRPGRPRWCQGAGSPGGNGRIPRRCAGPPGNGAAAGLPGVSGAEVRPDGRRDELFRRLHL